MSKISRFRPSPSLVVASIALLVALGGTSIAAVNALPNGSVGTSQLVNGAVTTPKLAGSAVTAGKLAGSAVTAAKLAGSAVTAAKLAGNSVDSSKVVNHSLLSVDFKAGQIPAGLPGPQGAPGPQGPAGPAGPAGPGARWVFVGKDGNVIAQSAGLNAGITHALGSGTYYVNFGSALTGHALVVTSAVRDADSGFRGSWVTGICGGPPEGWTCLFSNNASTAFVGTTGTTNTSLEDHAFYIAVL